MKVISLRDFVRNATHTIKNVASTKEPIVIFRPIESEIMVMLPKDEYEKLTSKKELNQLTKKE